MRLVTKNRPITAPEFRDIIRDYNRISPDKTLPTILKDTGIKLTKFDKFSEFTMKKANFYDNLKKVIEKIDRHCDILYMSAKYPDFFEIESNDRNTLDKNLFEWIKTPGQGNGGLNKILSKKSIHYILMSHFDEYGNIKNEFMTIYKTLESESIFRFKTDWLDDSKKMQSVSGFFFDYENILAALGKFNEHSSIRSTHLSYSIKNDLLEIGGLRLTSFDRRPFCHRIVGIEISEPQSALLENLLQIQDYREMLSDDFPIRGYDHLICQLKLFDLTKFGLIENTAFSE